MNQTEFNQRMLQLRNQQAQSAQQPTIPVAPKYTPSLWDKIKGATLPTLSWIGDKVSRPGYAVSNLYNEAAKSAKGQTFNTNPFSALWEGFSGKKKTTTKDVLTTAGVGDLGHVTVPFTGGKQISGKGALGLLGDIVLDPTTYLTLGTGKGITIATKGGEKVLTQKGGTEFLKLAESMGKDVNKVAERTLVEQAMEKAIKKAPDLVDRGGIKIAGRTIPLTDKITNPVEKIIKTATSKVGRDASIVDNLTFKRQQQAFRDLTKEKHLEIANTYNAMFKGLSKEERKLITTSLEDSTGRMAAAMPYKLRAAHEAAKAEFADILAKEQASGLSTEAMKDYVTHLYTGKNDQAKIKSYFNQIASGTETKFAKERTLEGTLTEIEQKLGLTPEYDIEKILATRRMSSEQAIAKHNFLMDVGQVQGRQSTIKIRDTNGILPGMEKFAPVTKEIPNPAITRSSRTWTEPPGVKELSGISIPDNVASYVSRMFETLPATKHEALGKIASIYDKLQNIFKTSVTTYFPSFHTRNKMSNIWSNILDVGLFQTLSPKKNLIANKIMSSKFGDEVVNLGGKDYTIDSLRTMMKENGVLSSAGYFDINNIISKANVGKRVGSYIENSDRALNFIANLDMIGDPITAAERTKKFLFDYENLSDMEKAGLKRLFPFYTWTSKNMVLQAEQLFRQPGKYAGLFKTQNALQGEVGVPETDKEKANRPKFLNNTFNIKTGNDEKGNPIYASGLGNPLENFAQTLASPTSVAENMLSPLIKIPYEAKSGQDLYQNKDIKDITNATGVAENLAKLSPSIAKLIGYNETTSTDFTGAEKVTKTANPWALWIMRQPPFSRFYSTANQVLGSKDSTDVVQSLTGLKSKNSQIDSQIYYDTRDQYFARMNPSEQATYTAIYGNKMTSDNTNWKTIEKSSTLLAYPQILQTQNEMQRELALKTGNPIDPFYMLPDDQQKTVLTYQALPKGDETKSVILKDNQWLLDYWDTSSKFWKDAGAAQNTGFSATPFEQSLLDQYYALPSGTGARTRFSKAHPQLVAYWNRSTANTNSVRSEMGLPGLPASTYSSSSSSPNLSFLKMKFNNLTAPRSTNYTTSSKVSAPVKLRSAQLKALKSKVGK
jgi:hypothetical protein